MKKIQTDELKALELNILSQIHELCQKEKIRYSMVGGTLLGAVRHNGFIPWDDDIDIVMPRPDYNRFIEYCKNNNTPFGVISHQTDSMFCSLYAKAYDKKTIIKEEFANRFGSNCGVYVDIFPADGLGSSLEEAKKTLNSSRFYRELLIAADWKHFVKSKTHAWYIEPIRFAFFILSRFANPKKIIKKIEATYINRDFDCSDIVGVVCGSYRDREMMPFRVYTEYELMKFEDKEFYGLKFYDEYLKKIYGNYMELPSESKRVTHHSFTAYYLD